MNRFLIFHELLNIVPKAVFVGDYNVPAPRILFDSFRVAKTLKRKPAFYINRNYQNIFVINGKYPSLKTSLKFRLKTLLNYKDLLPWVIDYNPVHFFDVDQKLWEQFTWAKSLNDRLYWFRGSLTTAINLCTIIYPDSDILLAGVDLNTSDSFYSEELKKHPHYTKKSTKKLVKETGMHNTVIDAYGVPPIHHGIKQIVEYLKLNLNITISCLNPESLLVQEGICAYKKLPDT